MPKKIESLFFNTFGFKPSILEPRPTTVAMEKMIRNAHVQKTYGVPIEKIHTIIYEIADSGGTGKERWTRIVKTNPTGDNVRSTYIFDRNVSIEKITSIAESIPESQWCSGDRE